MEVVLGEQAQNISPFRSPEHRFIGKGLAVSRSVLDVFRVLMEDPEVTLRIAREDYRGYEPHDPRVHDLPDGRLLKVLKYYSHRSQFNFGLMGEKLVHVEFPNRRMLPRVIYHNYSFIEHGKSRLAKFEAAMSQDTFVELQIPHIVPDDAVWQSGCAYPINLVGMDLVPSNWSHPQTFDLPGLLYREKELRARLQELNRQQQFVGRPRFARGDGPPMYRGRAVAPRIASYERIQAPCVEIRLVCKRGERIDVPNLTDFDQRDTEADLRHTRRELRRIRFLIRAIVFAMESCESNAIAWDKPKVRSSVSWNAMRKFSLGKCGDRWLQKVEWIETFDRPLYADD